jgi:hypothetical protein
MNLSAAAPRSLRYRIARCGACTINTLLRSQLSAFANSAHFVIMPKTDQNRIQVKTKNLIQNETAVATSPILSSYVGASQRPTRHAIICDALLQRL